MCSRKKRRPCLSSPVGRLYDRQCAGKEALPPPPPKLLLLCRQGSHSEWTHLVARWGLFLTCNIEDSLVDCPCMVSHGCWKGREGPPLVLGWPVLLHSVGERSQQCASTHGHKVVVQHIGVEASPPLQHACHLKP